MISAIVTTRNAERTLGACLASLRSQSTDVEIIVVDNQSNDATVAIAERHADVVFDFGPERSAQRNAGAKAAQGSTVAFIDADMVVEPGVLAEAERLLIDRSVSSVVIPERSFGVGFWARCKALEKLTVIGDESVEAARVFRRDQFLEEGGYNEQLTACEDWDLADRMRAFGTSVGRTEALIWHDEGRLQLRGTFAKKRYYGRWVATWLKDAPPHRTRRSVRGRLVAMCRQPLTAMGLVCMKLVEAAGFAAGAKDARDGAPR